VRKVESVLEADLDWKRPLKIARSEIILLLLGPEPEGSPPIVLQSFTQHRHGHCETASTVICGS
jgi:hypothetical protein